MNAAIFYCPLCQKGFYFTSQAGSPEKCPECEAGNLQTADDWEEFRCLECDYQLDGTTLRIHGNLQRIPQGVLRCKYDDNFLKFVG